MAYLDQADVAGQVGRPLRTHGGRLIQMHAGNANEMTDRAARSQAAARGRFGRNAMIQGAAAEFFKVWAVTVRARAARLEARIVLCLHDELLLHVPAEVGEDAARLLDDCLQEAAARWAPGGRIRFIADVGVVQRWADAKG
jgi:DNA polymerase-1